jgi:isopenicillin N synthase-like dioxygenase
MRRRLHSLACHLVPDCYQRPHGGRQPVESPAVAAAAATVDGARVQPCVVIPHAELVAGAANPSPALQTRIEAAYGYAGLGILAVTGVPGLASARRKMLPLGARFAALPDAIKKQTERPHAFYQAGWSHGNEILQSGRPDYAKGSYYANPLVDRPSDDAALVAEWPSFLEPNVWPDEDVLPGFEAAFKQLGRQVVAVGMLLACQCDDYVAAQCPGYQNGQLRRLLGTSKCCKGRLLHYFPVEDGASQAKAKALTGDPATSSEENTQQEVQAPGDSTFSDWCGWHNDHGSLTGLVPAMYLDRFGREVPNPDPLAVRHRQLRVRVEIMRSQQCRIVGKSQSAVYDDQSHYLHPHP